MPACSSELVSSSVGRYRSSSPPNSRSNSVSPPLTWPVTGFSPPLSVSPSESPPATGKDSYLKRSISNVSNASSLLTQVRSRFTELHSEEENQGVQSRSFGRNEYEENSTRWIRNFDGVGSNERTDCPSENSIFSLPGRIIIWYMNLVLRVLRRSREFLYCLLWAPIVWISAWICVFWLIIQLPLNTVNFFISAIFTTSLERSRKKRCVLISGGSTIQALHLARNFYKAGARVVVCEVEGLFGLARFSTACSRFYNVPRPGPGNAAEYVNALKEIVEREKVVYYIPVSCTSDAYYDSLAKNHLQIMGCECFVPGAADVTSLEDPLQLMQRCATVGLTGPNHRVIRSPEDLARLYETGHFSPNERTFSGQHSFVMMSAGPAGMIERSKLHLPSEAAVPRNLKQKLERHEISERRPWIVLKEPSYQFVTCTTVKDSRVVANVTCRLDETQGLVAEDRDDVNQWLETFFKGTFVSRINGHLSFKLALDESQPGHQSTNRLGTLVPISCRVGVPLPYLCLTSIHPRLVWQPCRHFSRHNSTKLIVSEKYKMANQIRSMSYDAATMRSSVGAADDLLTNIRNGGGPARGSRSSNFAVTPSYRSPVLDKRDALFVYWDPLPYCAYYHLQFPFRRLAGAIRPGQRKPPLAIVQ